MRGRGAAVAPLVELYKISQKRALARHVIYHAEDVAAQMHAAERAVTEASLAEAVQRLRFEDEED